MRYQVMKARTLRFLGASLILAAAAGLALAPAASAQQILLDKPVRAAELILFPDINDENVYYYVCDKPRLATGENERPQFSFLRYVENVRSAADEAEIREGEGGGIVHALVALSVTEDQLKDAQRALRRIKSEARIEGPVVFKSGTFGLVSAFTDSDGNLSHRVVGLGNAPLLDGEKAAVSLQLTKQGAKILWESFKTPTPDVSFTFEMDLDGYRSPKRAVIEADFDRIYEHRAFDVGLESTYLAAEIQGAFDDLREDKAIRLTEVGEDEQLEELIGIAYRKITDLMFQPVQGTGTPDLASLARTAGGEPSLLDRASEMLAARREEARNENEAIRRRNDERRRRQSAAAGRSAEATEAGAQTADQRGRDLEEQAAQAEARAERLRQRAAELESRDDFPEEYAALNREIVGGVENQAATLRRLAGESRSDAAEVREEVASTPSEEEDLEEEERLSSFALVATYEMKRLRQRGTFRVDLNKYTSDSLTLRFDENIGDLRRYIGDQSHFREVNLDDPLFKQREIVAFIDGLNAGDFGEYVNFVTLHMRKRHEGGGETHDEVRIDRNNFNAEGNSFKLLYGWKGDNDRRHWLDYEYRTYWSFFGGSTVEDPDWRSTSSGAINLAPPYQRREVTLEADPAVLAQFDRKVRSITVKIYYQLGGEERVRLTSLNPSTEPLSKTVEFMLPADVFEYEYEISWRLYGNESVTSGRQKTSEPTLYVDEVPAT